MKNPHKSSLLAIVISICAMGLSQAVVVLNTVGVYDSTNNANAVDRVAAGSISLTTFTTDVATAFSNNLGGVIDFNTGSINTQTGIDAKYGTGLGKTLSISTSSNYNIQTSNNIRAISDTQSITGHFLLDSTATQFSTFTVGSITNGSVGEVVTQFGFTILARNGGGTPTIVVTATFSNATTASASAAFTVTSTIPSTTEDSFYGFTAPAGKSISSVQVNYGAAGDLRRGIDDIAFVTSVIPEPSTFLMGLGGVSLLFIFRRRCH